MKLAIRGMGWVTPLGNDIANVWNRLLESGEAQAATVSSPISPHSYPAFRVSEIATTHPRLRRSSAISRFADVTLPEDILERIDKSATSRGLTRSAFLTRAAKRELETA